MSNLNVVGSTFNATVGTANIRLKRWPANAIGVTVTPGKSGAFGTYVQVAAVNTIDDPSWLVGVQPSNFVAATAVAEFAIDVSAGAAGSASLSATQGVVGFSLEYQSQVGASIIPYLPTAFPIKISGKPVISAGIANMTTTTQPTMAISVYMASGVGT